jgi:FkbM family methyltransferase
VTSDSVGQDGPAGRDQGISTRALAIGRARQSAAVDWAKFTLRRVFHVAGLDVHKAHGSLSGVRQRLNERNEVAVVFDVGANRGQYGWELRAGGYAGRICSFEPLATAYQVLESRAASDPAWLCWPLAVSDRDGKAVLNVSANSVSSSLLDMAEAHVAADPKSRNLTTEEVSLSTLDAIVEGSPLHLDEPCGLKIDTQGHEWEVLDGATQTLSRCVWLEIELSLEELYTGQRLFPELLSRVSAAGFNLIQLEPVFSDPRTGKLLQVNGLFAAGATQL